jgi:uncharacterized membrane protein
LFLSKYISLFVFRMSKTRNKAESRQNPTPIAQNKWASRRATLNLLLSPTRSADWLDDELDQRRSALGHFACLTKT